jgi:hypothetical protein
MAKLTAGARKRMPRTSFALPGSKRFPMPDASHARAAISGATRSERAGNISASTEASIKAKARRKLGITKTKKAPRPKVGAAALSYNITKKPQY